MGKFTPVPRLQIKLNADAQTVADLSSDQCERLIAIRLHSATNLEVDQDASHAWNNRRIIRARMRYYASPHTRVIN